MSSIRDVFRDLQEALAAGRELLLLADYDGTLTPILPDPRDAWLGREVRADLRTLARSGRAQVALISGRGLQDLQTRVGLADLIYAGCHGLEVQGPGLVFEHPAAATKRGMLCELAQALAQRTASIPGVRVEPKSLAIAVHYRNMPWTHLDRLEAEVGSVLGPYAGLRLLGGHRVVEVLPTSGWDKGQCAVWLRERLQARTHRALVTLYLGDDSTDEIAFVALGEEALTVRVGRGASAARYRVDGVKDVQWLLTALAAEIRGPLCT